MRSARSLTRACTAAQHRYDVLDDDFFNLLVAHGLDYCELPRRRDADYERLRRNSIGAACLLSFGDERIAVFEIFLVGGAGAVGCGSSGGGSCNNNNAAIVAGAAAVHPRKRQSSTSDE